MNGEDVSSNQLAREAWQNETDPTKRASAIWSDLERIERAQEYRKWNDLLHASLYGNASVSGFTPKSYGNRIARAHTRLSLNVVRNMINTVVSKIAAKNKVHPKFSTNDGDASLQRKAKKMERVAAGIFYEAKFYRTQRKVFRDIAMYGTGFVRPWKDEAARTVTIKRVAPQNIIVDDEEGMGGEPRRLHYREWYDRRVLAQLFPNKVDLIRNAGKRTQQGELPTSDSDTTADLVCAIESFYLPSRAGADDGLRVVSLDNGELGSEPWKFDYHPFPKLCWVEDADGFFGTGLAYELAGIQRAIDDILEEFERAHRLIKGMWAVEHGAKVLIKHLNDDLGKIIRYAGVAPHYYQPVAIPQDTYKYLWDLYARAYEIAGISQLSATGQKPAGLNSGEAQRVYLDNESERFLEVGENLSDFTMDVTVQSLDRARELAEGGYRVSAMNDNGLELVDFKDVDLPKDSYRIQVFPTSYLPQTPAGRLAMIQDLVEMGIVADEGDAMKLLGFPDLEAFMARKNAPRELLESNIESILEKGKWVAPEPLDDHVLALTELPMAISRARVRGVEKERVSMARRYVVLSARLQRMKLAGQIDGAVVENDPMADPGGAPLPPEPPLPGMEPPPGAMPPEPMGVAA